MSNEDTDRKSTSNTAFVNKARVDEERAEEARTRADDRLFSTLKEQLDEERIRSKNLTRFIIFENILILVMLGVAVGVVRTGSMSLFGFGDVELGATNVEVSVPASGPPESPIDDTGIVLDLYYDPIEMHPEP